MYICNLNAFALGRSKGYGVRYKEQMKSVSNHNHLRHQRSVAVVITPNGAHLDPARCDMRFSLRLSVHFNSVLSAVKMNDLDGFIAKKRVNAFLGIK